MSLGLQIRSASKASFSPLTISFLNFFKEGNSPTSFNNPCQCTRYFRFRKSHLCLTKGLLLYVKPTVKAQGWKRISVRSPLVILKTIINHNLSSEHLKIFNYCIAYVLNMSPNIHWAVHMEELQQGWLVLLLVVMILHTLKKYKYM